MDWDYLTGQINPDPLLDSRILIQLVSHYPCRVIIFLSDGSSSYQFFFTQNLEEYNMILGPVE
jgi:hypothetical protein